MKFQNNRKVSLLVVQAGITVCLLAAAIGCGDSSTAQTAAAPGKGTAGAAPARTPGAQLKSQLNAMSVPDRIAYLKAHHDTQGMMNGGGPSAAPASASNPTGQ
ncbi:MAG TPA: hypothetical protein VGL56_00735 [Fimbriimonadaceae bacterium]|jgi:hypothetical protein